MSCPKSTFGVYTSFKRFSHRPVNGYIAGLYSERSQFNHGASEEPTPTSSDDRLRALFEFRERTLNWDVLRKMCLDVIGNQLQDSIDAKNKELAKLLSPIRKMLHHFFDSEQLWNEIAKPFTAKQSVKTIKALSGTDLDDFVRLCCSYLNGHRWEAMRGKAVTVKILTVLKTMGEVIHDLSEEESEDRKAGKDLYDFADENDLSKIKEWDVAHATWDRLIPTQDLKVTLKAVASHTAKLFRY